MQVPDLVATTAAALVSAIKGGWLSWAYVAWRFGVGESSLDGSRGFVDLNLNSRWPSLVRACVRAFASYVRVNEGLAEKLS